MSKPDARQLRCIALLLPCSTLRFRRWMRAEIIFFPSVKSHAHPIAVSEIDLGYSITSVQLSELDGNRKVDTMCFVLQRSRYTVYDHHDSVDGIINCFQCRCSRVVTESSLELFDCIVSDVFKDNEPGCMLNPELALSLIARRWRQSSLVCCHSWIRFTSIRVSASRLTSELCFGQ